MINGDEEGDLRRLKVLLARLGFYLPKVCTLSAVAIMWFSFCAQADCKPSSISELQRRLGEIERLVERSPDDIEVREKQISTLELLGRRTEALALCEGFLKARPDRGFLWYYLGFCKFREDKWQEALSSFNRAEELGDTNCLGLKAFCLRKLNRHQECLEFTTNSLRQYPTVPSLYFNRALARRSLYQSKTLVCADMKKAAELAPDLIHSYQVLCGADKGK